MNYCVNCLSYDYCSARGMCITPYGCCTQYQEKCRTITTSETVYNQYTDTVGNYHWTGAYSGEHTIRMDDGEKR